MDGQEDWVDVGSVEELARTPLKSCKAQAIPIAISFKDGQFGAVSNVCNHVGGRLATAVSTAITSLVPGTVGSSIAAPASANQDSKRIACRHSRSRSRAAACSS